MNNMEEASKQHEALRWASLFLEKHNRELKVAEILLQHHLQVSRAEFLMGMREEVPDEILKAFRADVKRHAETGIPVQHLTGSEQFYGRNFSVSSNVLIPRPETEELVEHVIGRLKHQAAPTIVDIGTGSGVIAISLALELPESVVLATDISQEALDIAVENAKRLHASVQFLCGSYLEPLIASGIQADIIVSNPPYIAKSESPFLSDTVRIFDPELALFAENEGLAAYENIIRESCRVLKPGGLLAFEIGHEQGEAVKALIMEHYPESLVQVLKDINGKDRIVTAETRKSEI